MDYGITIRVPVPFAEAAVRVRDALKAQGFGVLTEIDVHATLACSPACVHNQGISRLDRPGDIVVRGEKTVAPVRCLPIRGRCH